MDRHAVRYNMLVNPTGKPGKFRGVDWVEESMINLYTKACLTESQNSYDPNFLSPICPDSIRLGAADLITPKAES